MRFACTGRQRQISDLIFKQPIAFPRREFARVAHDLHPKRVQGMPGAQRARSLACKIKKHTSIITTVTPDTPGIPRAMVLMAYFVISPVIGLCCHRRLANTAGPRPVGPTSPPQNLTPASRRQDHTTSPSAATSFVCTPLHRSRVGPRPAMNDCAPTPPRPPHPVPNVRDDRETPLSCGT